MKLFLSVFTLIFIISCNTQQNEINITEPLSECDCNELKLDPSYNRFYLTHKKEPFTGHCLGNFPNSTQLKIERNYVEGKYHGDVIDYYFNGKIKKISEYKNHFINGTVKEFSADGELLKHYIYKQSTLMETLK